MVTFNAASPIPYDSSTIDDHIKESEKITTDSSNKTSPTQARLFSVYF